MRLQVLLLATGLLILYDHFTQVTAQAPSAPENFQLFPVSSTSLMGNWTASPSATNYAVYCKETSGSTNNTTSVTNQTSVYITNLKPFTSYTCYVKATSNNEEGDASNNSTSTTNEAVPSSPQSFSLSSVAGSPTQLFASWSVPLPRNGIITGYSVYCNTSANQAYPEQMIGSNVPTIRSGVNGATLATTLTGLNPYTQYSCYVTANTSVGEGSPSTTLTERTVETAPPPPYNLTAYNASSTAITLNWTRPQFPNGPIQYYEVVYYPEGNINGALNTTTPNTTLTISGLTFYTLYFFNVSVVTGGGTSPFAGPISQRTSEDAPSPPLNVMAYNTSSTSIMVTWQPPLTPNGIIRGYQVNYFVTGGNGATSVVDTNVTDRTVLTGLSIYTTYTIFVRAKTVTLGDNSTSVMVSTNEDAPGAPSNLTASVLNSMAIVVFWSSPFITNGIILRYDLFYTNTNLDCTTGTIMFITAVPGQIDYNATLTGLDPYTAYKLCMQARTAAGPGNIFQTTVKTYPGISTPPTSFSVTPLSSTSVELMWGYPVTPRGPIQGYVVTHNVSLMENVEKINISTSNSIVQNITVLTNDTGTQEHMISGLTPYTTYSFSVRAYSYNPGSDGPLDGEEAVFVVTTAEDFPSSPQSFSLSSVAGSPTQLFASWSVPIPRNGIITGYSVYCNTSANQAYPEQMIGPNVPTIRSAVNGATLATTLTGLNPYTQYSCYVTANTSEGQGSPSTTLTQRTVETAPPPPYNLTAYNASSTAITLNWKRPQFPNGPIQYYEVVYYPEGNINGAINTTTPNTTLTISGLTFYTLYFFNVSVVTGGGTSPFAGPISQRTSEDAPSPPLNVMVYNISSTSIMVTWQPPLTSNGIIRGYQVNYFVLGEHIETVDTDNTLSTLLTGLSSYVNYTIFVRARTVNLGTNSTFVMVSTNEDVPSSPQNFSLSPVAGSPTQLSASWSVPIPRNGEGSSSAVATALTTESVPSSPQNFSLSPVAGSPTQLSASWSVPIPRNGIITGYSVYCNTSAIQAYPEQMIGSNVPTIRSAVNGATLATTLTGLNPYTQYSCYVTANTSVGEGSPSTTLTERTVETAPPPPYNLTAYNDSSTAITLNWARPQFPNGPIQYYEVVYYPEGNINGALNTTTPNTTLTISGLTFYTLYFFNVSVVTGGGTSPFAGPISQRTSEDAPSPPLNVMAYNISSTSIMVTWQPPLTPNGIIRGYQVNYFVLGGRIETVDTDTLSTLLTGLSSYVNYTIFVRARTVNLGTNSTFVMAATNEDVPSSSQNFSLSPVAGSPTQLSASWSVPLPRNGVITGYSVYCNTSANQAYPEQVIGSNVPTIRSAVNGTTLATTLTGLNPYTQYSCYVTANTSVGEGSPSTTLTQRTVETAPPPPYNLTAYNASSTAITLNWTRPQLPNGPIQYYEVVYYPEGNINGTINTTTPNTTLTISGLTFYTLYFFNVSVVTGGGTSPFAGPISQRTSEDAPSPPLNVMVYNISSTSIMVTWQPPLTSNGIIRGYQVNYFVLGEHIETVDTDNTLSTLLTGLSSYVNYTIFVRARTVNLGTNSTFVMVSTNEDVPSSPQNFSLSPVAGSPTQLSASWSVPIPRNGIITGYSVYCNTSANQTYPEQMIGPNVPTIRSAVNGATLATTLTGLNPYTQYSCYVTANTSVGEGSPSAVATALTTESVPSSPQNFSLSPVVSSPTQLSASWSVPIPRNGIITGYSVYCNTSANQTYPEQIIGPNVPTIRSAVNGTTLATTLTGLNPYTQYSCYVTANTSVGVGSSSSILTALTTELVPSSPQNFSLSSVAGSPTQLSASWSVPIPRNGIITGYSVYCNTSAIQAYPEQMIGPNVPTIRSAVNGTTLATTLTGLNPYTQYSCYVTANTSVGQGSPSTTLTQRTVETAPPPPYNLTAYNDSSTAITLNWARPQFPNGPIQYYEVVYYPEGNINGTINTTTPNTTLTISGLTFYTLYFFNVSMVTGGGTSPFAGPFSQRTSEDAPSLPLNVMAYNISSTSIMVTWQPPLTPNGIIRGYQVNYFVLGERIETVDTNNTLSTLLTGLSSYVNYTIFVRARTVNLGMNSTFVMASTNEDVPSSPQNFSLSPVAGSPTQLSASWSVPIPRNGIITGYSVYCNTSANQTYPEQMIGSNVPTIRSAVNGATLATTLTGLNPYTQYSCYVTANTSVGVGSPSTTLTQLTVETAPPPPYNLTAYNASSTAITLNWTRPQFPNGPIQYYEVVYYPEGNINGALNNTTPNTTLTISGLTFYTLYFFNVSVVTGGGTSPFAGPISQRTSEDAPSPPLNVMAYNISSTSIMVTWQPPLTPNGIIRGYQVNYFVTRGNGATSVVDTNVTDSTLLTGLSIYTTYTIFVRAKTVIYGNNSTVIMVATNEDVPGAPIGLLSAVINSSILFASWQAPPVTNGIITSYSLYYSISGVGNCTASGMKQLVPSIPGVTTYNTTLTNLVPYGTYSLCVQASTRIGFGDLATAVIVTTDPDSSSPPTNFTAIALSSTSIRLTWGYPESPRGPIAGYQIVHNTSLPLNPVDIISNDSSQQTYTFSGLSPFKAYFFAVRAFSYLMRLGVSAQINGSYSSVVSTTKEDVPSMPLNYQLSAVSSSVLLGNWTAPSTPNGIVTNYTVYCRKWQNQTYPEQIPPSPLNYTVFIVSSQPFVYLSDLQPFTFYQCYVTANTSAGEGNSSNINMAQTVEAVSSSPQSFSLSSVAGSPTQLSASWSVPIPRNGIITGYSVYCNTSANQAYPEQVIGSNVPTIRSAVNGTTLATTLTGLNPYTQYSCYVTANTSVGQGSPSTTLTQRTVETAPPPPYNLTAYNASSTAITLNWARPQFPNGSIQYYEVVYYPEGNINGAINTTTPNTTLTISGLTFYTLYFFNVSVVTGGGTSPFAGPISQRTSEDAPSPPLNVMAFNISSTSIMVTWQLPQTPNGIIRGYQVNYFVTRGNGATSVVDTNVTDSTLLTGLSIYTTYTIFVRAKTVIYGNNSTFVMVATNEDVPGAPIGLLSAVINSSILSASWQAPPVTNGIITSYSLYYSISGVGNCTASGMKQLVPSIPGVTTYNTTLTNLVPYGTYSLCVQASTRIGFGDLTTAVIVTTDPDSSSPPTNFTAIALSSTSIRLTWGYPESPRGPIAGYQIVHNTSLPLNPVDIISNDSSQQTYTFSGLSPFKAYYFAVRAFSYLMRLGVSTQINGSYSSVVSTTKEDVPSMPLNYQLSAVSSSVLLGNWTAPSTPNGIVTNYTVYCRKWQNQTYPEQIPPNPLNYTVFNVSSQPFVYLSDLQPFTFYQCYVTANTSAGEGNSSNINMAQTVEAVPSSPQSFSLSPVAGSPTQLSASWSVPIPRNGIITGYSVYCNTSANQAYPEQMIGPNVPTIRSAVNGTTLATTLATTLTGLNPYTQYSCYVTANTSVGEGSSSTTLTQRTVETAPPPPYNLTAYNASSTAITLNWARPQFPNGSIQYYEVVYYPEGNINGAINTTTQNTTLTISGLTFYTLYFFNVRVVTGGGTSPFAGPISQRTSEDAPSPPLNVMAYNISSTSIMVTWQPPLTPNGIIRGYQVNYFVTGGNGATSVVDTNVTNSTLLTGLSIYTTYTIFVRAMTVVYGNSTLVDVSTDEGIPSSPKNVTAVENGTVVTVSWQPPDVKNGPSVTYVITYYGYKNVTAQTRAGKGLPATASPDPLKLQRVNPPVLSVIDYPSLKPTTSPQTSSYVTVSFVLPDAVNQNGPVDKCWFIVQRLPSSNKTLSTYYESARATSNWPEYPSMGVSVNVAGRRKRETGGGTPVSANIGGTQDCGPKDEVCNGPLDPSAEYQVRYRLFVGAQFQDYNNYVTFTTLPSSPSSPSSSAAGIIAGIVVVIIVLVALVGGIAAIVVWKKRRTGKLDFASAAGSFIAESNELISKENSSSNVANHEPGIVPLQNSFVFFENPGAKAPLSPSTLSHKIYLKDFPSYFQSMHNDTGFKFSEEYEKVTEVGVEHSKESSLLPDNRAKNRYTNILAYDHSRVKLSTIDDDPCSDYINACYIPGHKLRRAYIATQGPLPSTFDDFWRMVWEQNVHTVVMLTELVEKGRTKCHRYWPEPGEPHMYGDINVEPVSEKAKEDWTIRELNVSQEKASRTLHHLQYTSWPDHGVPDTAITALNFVRAVRSYVKQDQGPVVVHCSAGVGRTGTFIALDILLQHIREYDWVDIFGLACEMRQHRNHMIQTERNCLLGWSHRGIVYRSPVVSLEVACPSGLIESCLLQWSHRGFA
eukprot:Em0021g365a